MTPAAPGLAARSLTPGGLLLVPERSGDEALEGSPLLMLSRHASMADTLLPTLLIQMPTGLRLRYVMKRELLWDPCIDVVGNRLPSYFVRRGSTDVERETRAIASLVDDIGEGDGVLIFPEGTRFTAEKRRHVLERLRERGESDLAAILRQVEARMDALPLPDGYSIYEAGAGKALKEGRQLGGVLVALAIFLVFVVMAVQYESLRNPLVILFSVPFALVGVVLGLKFTGLPLSMPVWLGMVMLCGIVVNNAIVLVEYIELVRDGGAEVRQAIVEAARLRLRPILMTTLTTVAGMLPLALGLGDGAEMLRPLAVTIVSGLSFSLLVSLLLVPVLYRWLGGSRRAEQSAGTPIAT